MTVTDVRWGAVDIARMLRRPEPTDEQVAVIEAPLGPLLVVAGAGSGKTETMSARVVHLIANGLVEPERVLGLTFTRKAAGELSERVRRRLRALRSLDRSGARASTLVAPTIATYNSYAAGLVADHALRLGVEPSSRLLGEAGRWQLAHDVVEQWSADLGVDLAPTTVTEAVLDLAGALAEHLRTPEELRAEAERLVDVLVGVPPGQKVLQSHRTLVARVHDSLALRARLADLVVDFTERKRAADLIDFSDQVALAARLAQEVPEVGATERARYGVVLLDEYQDTSVAQLDLLRHLFGGAGAGAGHPVTAVGDPHQSIYGWRGASAGGLERFPEHFPASDGGDPVPAPVLALSTSWRNDDAVLDTANRVAGPLRATGSRSVQLPVLRARPGAGAGEVAVAVLDTVEEEARAVAEFVASRRSALTAARGTGEVAAEPVTAAVLCRKRSQFPAMQAALLEAGLPVEVVGLGGLLSTPEVVDIVSALEAVHDPSRGDSLMRLLTGPRARLGLADLHALADWAGELVGAAPPAATPRAAATSGPAVHAGDPPAVVPRADVVDERSIVDALDDLPRPGWRSRRGRALSADGRARLMELAGLLRALRGQTFLPVVDLVAEAERMLGLDIEVAAQPGRSPATARANLDTFRSVAAAFGDSSDTATLGAFLAWLDAARREERGLEAPVAEMDPGAVQLLTVHAAKGLEWDVVAVPGLVEKTFPDAGKGSGWVTDRGALPVSLRGDRDSLPDVDLTVAADLADLAARLGGYATAHAEHQLREERRLAYVAVTRARVHLLLCGSWWRDGSRPTVPSPFLREIAQAPDGPAEVLRWTPDPAGPGATGAPVKPGPPAQEVPVWPPPEPLGAARQRRVERAAQAVAAALAGGAGGDGELTSPVDGPEPTGMEEPAGPHVAGTGDVAETGAAAMDVGDLDVRDLDVGDLDVAAMDLADLLDVAGLLLDERRRGRSEATSVPLPAHLSASGVVRLAQDRAEFARQLRRPVPLAPSAHARRGTAFHSWVERWFGSAALVDVDALPGADDESVADDPDLAQLQQTFLASPWARRAPVAIEVDVETPVAGVVVRSRIDAVFAEPGGGVVVVDWKTGRPPTDPQDLRTRELQLAVYRLAWSRWKDVPLESVDAAFFYVSTGETVRPSRMLGADEVEAVLRRSAPGR